MYYNRLNPALKLLLIVTLIGSGLAFGASDQTRKIPALRDSVYQRLLAAQQAQKNDDSVKAEEILTDLKNLTSLNSYERATTHDALGYLYFSLDLIPNSIAEFEQVVEESDIPEGLEVGALYTLSQLYMMQENYPAAIRTLKRWFSLNKQPNEDAYALMAQAYYQTNNHQLVVNNLLKAIDLIETKNQKPREQWLQLLQHSYVELGLAEKQIAVLKWLIQIYPRRDYLLALSSSYGILEQTSHQLAVLETAYHKGYLTDQSQLLTLASLQFSQGAPYKAAKTIEQGMKDKLITRKESNLRFLASTLVAAREHQKAIPVLEEAARLAKSGTLYRMVGNAHFQLGQWDQAARNFELASRQKEAGNLGRLWMMAGQSHVNARQFDKATAAFEKAKEYKEFSKPAQQWLRFTKLEQQRYLTYKEYFDHQNQAEGS